jgi:hypothetical protein
MLARGHNGNGWNGTDAQFLGTPCHVLLVHVMDTEFVAFSCRESRDHLDSPIARRTARAEDINLTLRRLLARFLCHVFLSLIV